MGRLYVYCPFKYSLLSYMSNKLQISMPWPSCSLWAKVVSCLLVRFCHPSFLWPCILFLDPV